MGSDAASIPGAGEPADTARAEPGVDRGPLLASVVMFVSDLDRSVEFYRELLKMRVTVRTTTAALLVGSDDTQVYVRRMGRAPTLWAASAFST
ncbi:VOC family protein [Streptomyces sp. NBC_00631]|uniref:VOC family protein n=1 Tax=Streptomyces sp. NBC_00631 TaxID=2975793 RepID=UPI0030E5B4B2